MKNTYIGITVKEDGKYISYAVKVSGCTNLLSALKINGIENATIFETRKKCEETMRAWNEAYKANGTYMFG